MTSWGCQEMKDRGRGGEQGKEEERRRRGGGEEEEEERRMGYPLEEHATYFEIEQVKGENFQKSRRRTRRKTRRF